MTAMAERLRWWLWSMACRLPGICPANAHTTLIITYPGHGRNPLVDGICRSDCARNGSCYCGKLRQP